MNKKIILLVLALVLLVGKVTALGVSPGKIILDFDPGMETTLNLMIINNEEKALSVSLNAEGELAEYITFSETELYIKPFEGSKAVSYSLKLPNDIGKSGLHTTNIVIRESKSVTGSGVNVGAALAVISILGINVPYQGKYAEASMFAIESSQGEETILVVEVTNLGKEDINTALASIDIFEGEKKITTVTTDEKSINAGNRRELIAKWPTEKPGSYTAKAKVNYDGKMAETETEFAVGGFFIKLIDISVKNFKLGGIAKFNSLLENIANKESEDVYTEMALNDETGKSIMDVESNRENMQPQERKEFNSYWDTENVEKGEYAGKVTIHADGKVWENPMSMDVQDDKIITRIGPTGMAIAESDTGFKSTSIIMVLLVVLIAINIGWFVYFRKRKNR